MELETTNRLYLELSQFVTAETAKEIELRNTVSSLTAELEKLQAFKDWVHTYLDQKGVPAEFPDGPHSKEGCRIGDRMDFVFAGRDALRVAVTALTDDIARLQSTPPSGDCISREAAVKVLKDLLGGWRAARNCLSSSGGDGPYMETLSNCADQLENTISNLPACQPVQGQVGECKRCEGHCQHIKSLERELADRRYELYIHEQKAVGEYWAWQDGQDDHLESLTCPVLIRANDLRELLKGVTAPAQPPTAAVAERASEIQSLRATAWDCANAIFDVTGNEDNNIPVEPARSLNEIGKRLMEAGRPAKPQPESTPSPGMVERVDAIITEFETKIIRLSMSSRERFRESLLRHLSGVALPEQAAERGTVLEFLIDAKSGLPCRTSMGEKDCDLSGRWRLGKGTVILHDKKPDDFNRDV